MVVGPVGGGIVLVLVVFGGAVLLEELVEVEAGAAAGVRFGSGAVVAPGILEFLAEVQVVVA